MWNSLVVGGIAEDGSAFLGTVGMIGTAFTDDHVATGVYLDSFPAAAGASTGSCCNHQADAGKH